MKTRTFAALAALTLLPAGAGAQPLPPGSPRGVAVPPGGLVIRNRNSTGGGENVTIARGATGADTYTSNAAAGSNAARPELAVPNGSGGGGGGGTR